MVKASTEPLKPNPFLTYRDPVTGLWVVVKNSNSSLAWGKADELVSQTTNKTSA